MSTDPESESVRIAKLEQSVVGLAGQMEALKVQLNGIGDKLSGLGRPNWGNWIAFVGLMFMILPAAWFVVQQAVNPLASAAAESRMDRGKMNVDIAQIAGEMKSLKGEVVELETQHRANSQIRNLMASHEQQIMAILWKRSLGEDLPYSNYYPDISLPKPQITK